MSNDKADVIRQKLAEMKRRSLHSNEGLQHMLTQTDWYKKLPPAEQRYWLAALDEEQRRD